MSDERESPSLSDHMQLLNQHLALLGQRLAPVDEFMKATFSWYVVAKKEFQDAVRSMGLWVLGALFTALFIIPPAGVLFFGLDLSSGAQEFGLQVLIKLAYKNMVVYFVPIISMFVGYGAITKERESGSLKLLMSLPHSRKDVVIGKVLGRCAVVGVPLAAAFGLTALFLVLAQVTLKPVIFGLFALYTIGFALVFVAIGVSLSGAFSRSIYSLVGNVVVYLYFTLGWATMANWFADFLRDTLGLSGGARWILTVFFKLLSPTESYKTLTDSMLLPGDNAARQARMDLFTREPWEMAEICTGVLDGKAVLSRGFFQTTVECQSTGGGLPFYATDAAIFVYVLLWIGLAALLSYRTFNLADL